MDYLGLLKAFKFVHDEFNVAQARRHDGRQRSIVQLPAVTQVAPNHGFLQRNHREIQLRCFIRVVDGAYHVPPAGKAFEEIGVIGERTRVTSCEDEPTSKPNWQIIPMEWVVPAWPEMGR